MPDNSSLDYPHRGCLAAVDIPGLLMTLIHILIFFLISSLLLLITSNRWRRWSLFAVSLVSVYWLQPAVSLRQFDFWFPTASIGLAVITWSVTRQRDQKLSREDITAFAFAILLPVLISLSRFLPEGWNLTPTRPPATLLVIVAGSILVFLAVVGRWLQKRSRIVWGLLGILILGLFVILKTETISLWTSSLLRGITGQSRDLAAPTDFYWLGFSYIAFRLLHVIRDRQAGRLPAVLFLDFLTYVLFFPAITAGPIDRVEKFSPKPPVLNNSLFSGKYVRQ